MSQSKNLYQIVANYSVIRVTGQDSEKFLQGQLTCDLTNVTATQATLGGYCNIQGRLHSIFYLLKENDDYLMVLPSTVAQHLIEVLSKYAVFFQTELLIDNSYSLHCLTEGLIKNLSAHYSKSDDYSGEQLSVIHNELGSTLSFNYPNNRKDRGYLLLSNSENNLTNILFNAHGQSSDTLWPLIQVTRKIPMVYGSTIEKLLPHYVGLDLANGVSFDKGCYTGQEVVARMHYRGTLKTHPHLATIDSEESLNAGVDVSNTQGKKVGELIHSAIDNGKTWVFISLADKGLEQELTIQDKKIILNS